MDPTLLIQPRFWGDLAPLAVRGIAPSLAALEGHVLFETSGSSGIPKQVALSKQALLVSADAVNSHLHVTADSTWGLALPVHHVGGFGVAARAYRAGCRLQVFSNRWNALRFGEWLIEAAVTHTSLVPTQVHDLVSAKIAAPNGLLAAVVGGGQLDAKTGQAARDLGWPVLASYGMTEAGSQLATQGLDALSEIYQPSPLPLLPIWGASTSDEGILAIRGPALFSGVVIDGIFTPRSSEWHQTSDRVVLENHVLTPLGRVDSLVKVLGELVDPQAIEAKLMSCSGYQLAPSSFAIVAIPDERAENRLIPVFAAGVDAALIDAALQCYVEKAAGYLRLGPPLIVEKLPVSELGKIRRLILLGMVRNILPE
ncbi:MAG: AMP-binding protein [Akkermansiaceae bacterium]|nr:AMP-binding protein [Akkermansiaceae bacterium]